MKTKVPVLVVSFGLLAGAIAWGVFTDARDARLQRLLEDIESAEDRVPYEGVRLLVGAETVKLRVASRDGHKRVEFLGVADPARRPRPSKGPKIPFFGTMPVFLRPGHDQWKRRFKDVGLAVRNYDVSVSGRETVAGRAADVVDVRARHPGRASYRIWADAENRFPLAFQVLSGGAAVFETRFQEVSFFPKFAERAFDEKAAPGWLRVTREPVPAERLAERAGFAVWAPSRLPRGFELRGAEVLRVRLELPEHVREAVRGLVPGGVPDLDVAVAHLNYTDGIAVLSVVEVPADSDVWRFLKRFVPAAAKANGTVVAQKFADRRGAAYLLELEGTVVLAAGNVHPDHDPGFETMIRSFERR